MKSITIMVIFFVQTQSHFNFNKFKPRPSDEYNFKYYAQKFNIDITGDQYQIKLDIFKKSLAEINEHNNNRDKTYFLKITPQSFMNDE